MPENFADRLFGAVRARRSCVVVGIDPRLDHLPDSILRRFPGADRDAAAAAASYREFGCRIADVVAPIVPAVKPQIAFFERLGPAGYQAYAEIVHHARSLGLIVIADVKRNDIGSTAEAYAEAYLGPLKDGGFPAGIETDAVTVNPYLGSDGIQPFIDAALRHGKGLFVLVRTSNPSAREFQNWAQGGVNLYDEVARKVGAWGTALVGRLGYSSVGAVVGATYPAEAAALRSALPKTPFLVPGYGAQGARAEDVAPCFNSDGLGAVVNAARSIIFAYRERPAASPGTPWEKAVESAALRMTEELRRFSPGT
jgi:orotidine-5'-phosphate decarboxylase